MLIAFLCACNQFKKNNQHHLMVINEIEYNRETYGNRFSLVNLFILLVDNLILV